MMDEAKNDDVKNNANHDVSVKAITGDAISGNIGADAGVKPGTSETVASDPAQAKTNIASGTIDAPTAHHPHSTTVAAIRAIADIVIETHAILPARPTASPDPSSTVEGMSASDQTCAQPHAKEPSLDAPPAAHEAHAKTADDNSPDAAIAKVDAALDAAAPRKRSSGRKSSASKTDSPKSPSSEGVPPPGAPLHNTPPERAPTRSPLDTVSTASSKRANNPIFHAPTLKHFATSSRTPQILESYILRALRENRRLDHILIHGRAGSGTTLLARALIRDFAPKRVIELDALKGCDPQRLQRAIERVGNGGVLFIRHIEVLDHECDSFLEACMCPAKPGTATDGSIDVTVRRARPVHPLLETPLDRAIADSARADKPAESPRQIPSFTLVGTAHIMGRLGYQLRTQFDHLIHLRSDPKALCTACCRALATHGVSVVPEAITDMQRLLGSLLDGAEPLVKAMIVRAELEGTRVLDVDAVRSTIEEDLANRVSNEQYAVSLREHLGGRVINEATSDEVTRISNETGWGACATRGAIVAMLREDRAAKNGPSIM